MKVTSSFLLYVYVSKVSRLVLVSAAALAAVIATGCGSSATQAPIANTAVTVMPSSTANDQLSQFGVVFSSITLTSKSGKTVNLLSAPQGAEFIHLNGTAEPLLTVNVPQDVYTAATATVSLGQTELTCVSILPAGGGLQTSEFGDNGSTPSATVTLPSPITITGTAMGLSLNLQVSQSATLSSCSLIGANYSITPTFTLTSATVSSPPTNVANGKDSGIDGLLASVGATGNGFSLVTGDGITLSLNTSGSTVYQGISGFSALAAGMSVDMDAAVQTDGSLLATRIAVEDSDPTTPTVLSGPLLFVVDSEPALLMSGREEQGYLFPGPVWGAQNFSFGNAVFQTSGQFTNLQSLPFVASFGAANMFPGQNVYITSHALTFAPGPTYYVAATVTLIPQTINGTINEISTDGSFTTYDVTLASYDLIPALAVQPGQTSVLTDPSNVVVYVDSNTQLLNTQTLAVGSVMRFNGLIFNNNGTASMDCGQVNDGVAE